MKKKYFLLTLILFSMLTQRVNAYCSSSEIQKFKEIERSIKTTKTYDEKTKQYTVIYYLKDLSFIGFTLKNEEIECSFISFNEYKCTSRNDIFDENISIVGVSSTCNDVLKERIATKKPTYNKYADNEQCKGIEDFVLCQKDYDKELTEEEFKTRVESYKKTKTKNNSLTTNQSSNKSDNNKQSETKKQLINFDSIIKVIQDNYILVIASIIFVILIIITIILSYKRYKQSRWLE